jgi:hypothetical protein
MPKEINEIIRQNQKRREEKGNDSHKGYLDGLRHLQDKYRGDVYICRILFLASISEETLMDFIKKVREKTSRDTYLVKPNVKNFRKKRS